MGTPHKSRRDKQDIPVFGFDYLHATEFPLEQSCEGESAKVLVAQCQATKCVFSHVVPQKGVDQDNFAVDALVKDIKWLGYNDPADDSWEPEGGLTRDGTVEHTHLNQYKQETNLQ